MEQLFTSQQQQSLVERLPETIRKALQSQGVNRSDDDIRAYVNVLFAVFERAYIESADDESMKDFYCRTLGRETRNALLTSDYFGKRAKEGSQVSSEPLFRGELEDIKDILDANVFGPK